jgi:galactoside O-acetyltransferase
MLNSFYDKDELAEIGFEAIGSNVKISRKASIYTPGAIRIGSNVRIDDFCILAGGSGIKLGNYIHVACFSALFGGSEIIMNDFSGLSARVTLYSESDDYSGNSLTNPTIPDDFKPECQKGRIIIGRHVIIGANSTVLPGVEVGEGTAVGAHSLVAGNCQAWSVYYGCPAKRYKARSKKILELEKALLKKHSD